jgi:hypothetical protein
MPSCHIWLSKSMYINSRGRGALVHPFQMPSLSFAWAHALSSLRHLTGPDCTVQRGPAMSDAAVLEKRSRVVERWKREGVDEFPDLVRERRADGDGRAYLTRDGAWGSVANSKVSDRRDLADETNMPPSNLCGLIISQCRRGRQIAQSFKHPPRSHPERFLRGQRDVARRRG